MATIHQILQTDLTIPDRALLIEVAAELASAAQLADDRANMNALNKAIYHLDSGVDVRLVGGDFLIPSGTRAGRIYRISGAGCSCEAGSHGRPCWHAAVAEIIAVAWERMGQDDDGDAGAADDDEPPPAYVVTTVQRGTAAELGARLAAARGRIAA